MLTAGPFMGIACICLRFCFIGGMWEGFQCSVFSKREVHSHNHHKEENLVINLEGCCLTGQLPS